MRAVAGGHTATVSEDNFQESVPFIHQVDPRDLTKVIRFASKYLYLPSHCADPPLPTSISYFQHWWGPVDSE